jgi:hypothetical protein
VRSFLRVALVLVALTLAGAQPAAGATLIDQITNVPIDGGSGPTIPAQTGKLQTGSASDCASPKSVPPTDPGSFNYIDFGEESVINEPTCITISYSTNDATCRSNGLFSASYAGGFDPTHIQANYLGDVGSAPSSASPVSYSVVLPPGGVLDTVWHMRVAGAGCSGFDLSFSSNRPWAYLPPPVLGHPFVGQTLTSSDAVWNGAPTFAR